MIQYVHVIFTPLLSVHKVGAWRLDEAVQKASVEEAAASSFPPKAGGLPRPLDYDDYWYEGEDGLWYNEYDDELEEGQYYEEVPEEDGYPKPDLTAVEAVDEEVVPDVIQPPTVARPEEKQQRQRKESQTDIDPDLRAAQEAAKAASDAAKNLLGGAMSFGGGFLGGLGGAAGGKTQQKTGGGGFGLGGFGLGGMMGGGAQAAKPATATSSSKPKPVMKKQEAVVEPTVPIHKEEQASAPGEPRPVGQQTNELGQHEEESEMHGRKLSNAETTSAEKHDEDSIHISVAEDSSTATTRAVTKDESLDSKKSVKFEETRREEVEEEARRLLQERAKEERHINRTRTMRPKEKWEWAFNRILKNLEVSPDPDRPPQLACMFLLCTSSRAPAH